MRGSLAFILMLTAGAGCTDGEIIAVPNRPPFAIASVGLVADGTPRLLGYVPIDQAVTLDGTLSDDTNATGEVAEFVWTFESLPEGSTLLNEQIVARADDPETEALENGVATFTPDVEGTYRINLVVIDDDEASSEPAIVVVEATPPGDLEITLNWEQGGADLDLHLVRPGGDYFGVTTADSDCFSWRPNPNWGDPAAGEDNPTLARDADTGSDEEAPFTELITLARPEEGVYLVYVHYYSDHLAATSNASAPTAASISVRAAGAAVENAILASPQSLNEGDVWVVGEVHWPEMAFGPIGQMTSHSGLNGPAYNQ